MCSPGSEDPRDNETISAARPIEVLRNSYFVLLQETLPQGQQLVRLLRTAAQFLDIADARFQYSYVITRLDRVGRQDRFLLIDLRLAPGRSDPAFEAMMTEIRPKLFQGFRRVGILTATAGGTLQVMRHTREDGVHALISSNESDLLSFFRVSKASR